MRFKVSHSTPLGGSQHLISVSARAFSNVTQLLQRFENILSHAPVSKINSHLTAVFRVFDLLRVIQLCQRIHTSS